MPDKIKVLILAGSDSDLAVMNEAKNILDEFGVKNEMRLSSAHRTPERTFNIVSGAKERGVKVIVAGAGMAAHLAGAVAAHTTLPVIGVPLDASPLKGIDAFVATLQMPSGVPVATMSIGKPGAKNAALLAIEILALEDARLSQQLDLYRKKMRGNVIQKDEELNR